MEWNAQVHTLSIDKSNNLQEDGSGRAFLESSFGSANLSIECEIREWVAKLRGRRSLSEDCFLSFGSHQSQFGGVRDRKLLGAGGLAETFVNI